MRGARCLAAFNAVNDAGGFVAGADPAAIAAAEYACGLFEFVKP